MFRKVSVCVAVFSLALALVPIGSFGSHAVSPNVVVNEVYGGGGNSGATLRNDFIELRNAGSTAVDVSGWSIQYASSTGSNWQKTNLAGMIPPGAHYLIQESQGAGGTVDLPAPDATGTIAMSATAGKVVLLNTQTLIATGTVCPSGATVVDLVGYGSVANCFEGSGPTGTLSNTTSAARTGSDTDGNSADFTVGTPTPRNSGAPSVTSTSPANGAAGVALDANVTVTFSKPVDVSGAWYSISCATSGAHSATRSGGPTTFTLDPDTDLAGSESCTVSVFAGQVHDQDTDDPPDGMLADHSFTFTTLTPPVRIREIQGASHTSPRVGQAVSGVVGIVTAKRSNGFYMQDPSPDGSAATSEGILVFTSSPPSTVSVGDAVTVGGTVTEFRAGSANLSTTEITSPTITVTSSGNALPAATVIGIGGRRPPTTIIEDDAGGNVESSTAVFDPENDGIDFYESLEGMLVQVDDAIAVGPTNTFGELAVVGDGGADAGVRTTRGGVVIRATDFNPERIILDDLILRTMPRGNVGDHVASVRGVMDYDFGNFKLLVTETPIVTSGGIVRETTQSPAKHELAVATFNVENLDPGDPDSKFGDLAGMIVENLKAPDLLALEEIQDASGPTNDGVVTADATFAKLAAAIRAAGGPTYEWRQIDPVNNQDGGEPGGNIRVGFLYRIDRGLEFVDRPGGTSTASTTVLGDGPSTRLSFSPGRIDPTNSAFNSSRKPLAAEFRFRGSHLFVIANHFSSKSGDQPLFGRFQPPTRSSEVARHQQVQIVNDFVDSILAAQPDAGVIVLGDVNDFEFSETMSLLEGGVLTALMGTLPQAERYSYVFDGNSQSLDHILLSDSLLERGFVYDPVHVNAEFHDQISDHDPQVVLLDLTPPANSGPRRR